MIARLWKMISGGSGACQNDSGKWGEEEAEKHLKSKGWKILGRRVRNKGREEIDLVARDGQVLVFVEVKTRAGEAFGRPISSVNSRKRALLCRAAARYLARLKDPRVLFRFDVVEVVGTPATGVSELRHIPNAFQMDRKYTI